jgi:hypothetical protein
VSSNRAARPPRAAGGGARAHRAAPPQLPDHRGGPCRPRRLARRADLGRPADPQLLKLFFGQFAAADDIAALARAQVERYERELVVVEELRDRLKARGDRPWQLAVGELFHRAVGAIAEQWRRIDRAAEDRSRSADAGQERFRAALVG